MATPYTAGPQETTTAQWQEPRNSGHGNSNFRSVTPAMNNTRGAIRNASPAPGRPGTAPGVGNTSNVETHYGARSSTPTGRYLGAFNSSEGTQQQPPRENNSNAPTSSGLIRLTLRKPMGIVFEPMYDPNSPSVQRGVRICDLPRTGAAALSRKLEVGDELLSINDKTMSRLSFDEIMDFIIEADPENVNLLFRRPRKETLKERHGIKTPSGSNGPGVKWIDDEARKRTGKEKKKSSDNYRKDKKPSRRSKGRDDDETLQSEDQDYRRGKKKSRRKDPYESESFLDILIDTICANPDSVCRDRQNADTEYYSDEDDETFASRDDSTYVTYESEEQIRKKKDKSKAKSKSKTKSRDDDSSTYDETEDETVEDKRKKKREPSPPKEAKRTVPPEKTAKGAKYEDDGTLETVESAERPKPAPVEPEQATPLGLAPNPEPSGKNVVSDTDDDGNPAPIKEVEYDEFGDNGADVSVMESLGGPSLLIEKQRQAAITGQKPASSTPSVPADIINNFGADYPLDFGFTREQTIHNDPLRFYTFVVKQLLQEHEPEKVRLLDKLLAKYRGREDHLVQKLSVRYNKEQEEMRGQANDDEFEDAVNKGKGSAHARATINAARERMDDFTPPEWPDKETKEPEDEDEQSGQHGEGSESATEYSGDSIDGTSPAVIAQVSELLNYVYGKTSVPGQIDRVSTIMRAYEGREAVLLELLETKALIKANREKENAGQLPSFLRNSANAQRNVENEMAGAGDVPPVTPMATQPTAAINDDISSMSGVSTPAGEAQQNAVAAGVLKQISAAETAPANKPAPIKIETKVENEGKDAGNNTPTSKPPPTPDRTETKKKKKGLFGGLFSGKKGKKSKDSDKNNSERNGSRQRGLRSPMSRKLKGMASAEGSI